jgi:hypothetical protein
LPTYLHDLQNASQSAARADVSFFPANCGEVFVDDAEACIFQLLRHGGHVAYQNGHVVDAFATLFEELVDRVFPGRLQELDLASVRELHKDRAQLGCEVDASSNDARAEEVSIKPRRLAQVANGDAHVIDLQRRLEDAFCALGQLPGPLDKRADFAGDAFEVSRLSAADLAEPFRIFLNPAQDHLKVVSRCTVAHLACPGCR